MKTEEKKSDNNEYAKNGRERSWYLIEKITIINDNYLEPISIFDIHNQRSDKRTPGSNLKQYYR